jgi:hypothetical protein
MRDDPDDRESAEREEVGDGEKRDEQLPEETEDEGRKPPPDDLSEDPAYEPDDPMKGIKGG